MVVICFLLGVVSYLHLLVFFFLESFFYVVGPKHKR